MHSIPFALLFVLLAAGRAPSPRADGGEQTPQEAAPVMPTSEQSPCFAQARPEPVPVSRRSPLSPVDSVCATVGPATLAVRYARPSVRGRRIFGALEPYNRVWRAGANAATSFTTTRDLVFGDVTVPAGDYTLYVYLEDPGTVPACDADGAGSTAGGAGWKLIINKQLGQWGTDYSQGQDLARIPMRMCRPGSPVDPFEIRIAPRGANAGTITLAWENSAASADFRVKS